MEHEPVHAPLREDVVVPLDELRRLADAAEWPPLELEPAPLLH